MHVRDTHLINFLITTSCRTTWSIHPSDTTLNSILYVLFQAKKSLEKEKGKGAEKLLISSNFCGKEADRATNVLISILANLILFYFWQQPVPDVRNFLTSVSACVVASNTSTPAQTLISREGIDL